MAYRKVDDTSLSSVANAIREKGGTSDALVFPGGFVSAIEAIKAIETTPVLQEKIVTPSTSAQEITPDSGYDGLSKVTVNAISYTETENEAGGITVTIGQGG